ncbi:MAG: hypothetical protein ACTHN8_01045 [Angustibacter sp.]
MTSMLTKKTHSRLSHALEDTRLRQLKNMLILVRAARGRPSGTNARDPARRLPAAAYARAVPHRRARDAAAAVALVAAVGTGLSGCSGADHKSEWQGSDRSICLAVKQLHEQAGPMFEWAAESLTGVSTGETARDTLTAWPALSVAAASEHGLDVDQLVADLTDAVRQTEDGWLRADSAQLAMSDLDVADYRCRLTDFLEPAGIYQTSPATVRADPLPSPIRATPEDPATDTGATVQAVTEAEVAFTQMCKTLEPYLYRSYTVARQRATERKILELADRAGQDPRFAKYAADMHTWVKQGAEGGMNPITVPTQDECSRYGG